MSTKDTVPSSEALAAFKQGMRDGKALLRQRRVGLEIKDGTYNPVLAELEFKPFPKIPRLQRECIVTEKIDGTNASIWIGEDGKIKAASRKRWITVDDDNYGFARWVDIFKGELIEGLGVGHHFGEWWGSGIQRRYGLTDGRKMFSLFNVRRWGAEGEETPPECCNVVPVLFEGEFNTWAIERALSMLVIEGSRAMPGYMKPEGVVVFHIAAQQLFKLTLDGDARKGKEEGTNG